MILNHWGVPEKYTDVPCIVSKADANVDDDQSYQEWPKAEAKSQVGAQNSWIGPPKNPIGAQIEPQKYQTVGKVSPGGDGGVCRVVDGTDGKEKESSANHLEKGKGKEEKAVKFLDSSDFSDRQEEEN